MAVTRLASGIGRATALQRPSPAGIGVGRRPGSGLERG